MAFEGLICPACSSTLDEKEMLSGNLNLQTHFYLLVKERNILLQTIRCKTF
jgi:hypothetical protein